MLVGDYVLRDLDVEGLAATFAVKTQAGAAALTQRLGTPTDDTIELEKRQSQLRDIRGRLKDRDMAKQCKVALATMKQKEEDVRSIAMAHDDQRHAEYYNQILWSPDSVISRLNTQTWFTELTVFLRTIFLPGMSIILPLLVFVAPFLIYYVVLKQPLTVDRYMTMLQDSFKKVIPSVLGKPRFAGKGGALEVGEKFMHVGASLAVFGASIWNQISAAISMRAIVADMRKRAASLVAFTEATKIAATCLGLTVAVPTWSSGELGAFGDAWNRPALVQELLVAAGQVDMLAAVAAKKRTAFVQWGDHVEITDIYHPGTSISQRVYNNVTLKDRNHVLLTGPNRGGKSTMLKSLGIAVLMAQTLGITFSRKAVLPVFSAVITALSPSDVVGKMSLFEAEIEFAKGVRTKLQAGGGPVFLMMDEIFHGTNAHDGVEASQIFLDDLYQYGTDRVVSVVSTHYMNLPERYEGRTANLCMEASEDQNDPDCLVYTYKLCEGINRHSSVREILRERGLLTETKMIQTEGSQNRGSPSKKQSASATVE
jgi:hypothetical protein